MIGVKIESIVDLCADFLLEGDITFLIPKSNMLLKKKVTLLKANKFVERTTFDKSTNTISFTGSKKTINSIPTYNLLLAWYDNNEKIYQKKKKITGFDSIKELEQFFILNKPYNDWRIYIFDDISNYYKEVFYSYTDRLRVCQLCEFESCGYAPIPEDPNSKQIISKWEEKEIERLKNKKFYSYILVKTLPEILTYLDNDLFYLLHRGKPRENQGVFYYEDKTYQYHYCFDFKEDSAWVEVKDDKGNILLGKES